MAALTDITDQKFGRLYVIKRMENNRTSATWACKCDCGSEIVVLGNQLRNGKTKSCGCLRREKAAITCATKRIFDKEESTLRAVWGNHKTNARKRSKKNRDLQCLEYDDWLAIVTQPCAFCGSTGTPKSWKNGCVVVINGVDRIDSSKPYTAGNVQTACGRCNSGKMSGTDTEWIEHCRSVTKHTDSLNVYLNALADCYKKGPI